MIYKKEGKLKLPNTHSDLHDLPSLAINAPSVDYHVHVHVY